MTEPEQKSTLGFQAEVKQLLHLMIHSLYSNREIFLRELISNASDANDRLRFAALSDPSLTADDPRLEIRISVDPERKTLAVTDTGIGMSRDEVIAQLGTIARSGTGEFLQQLTGDERRDANLIGQFGVGFYSSFIVAERVEVYTRRAGSEPGEGVHWESDGQGEYSVGSVTRDQRGTTVVLHLRPECHEFAELFRIRSLITRYSDHIAFPVLLPKSQPADDGEPEYEPVNEAKALWTRSRSEIGDEDYIEFYKHIAHDFEAPLTWSHNRVEGKREYTSLLYIPGQAPFDLWNRDAARGVKLYVQRVFIMDDAEQFLPLYLRFTRGVVDSSDLSLNVSRELLQQDDNVAAIRRALTRRVLDMLAKLASSDADKYQTFWTAFGNVVKEGLAEDTGNQDKILPLLRFNTTASPDTAQDQSIADYIGRMPETQKEIYYLVADSPAAARSSPQLEALGAKGLEVLLLTDRVDPWVLQYLPEIDGRPLRDVARGAGDVSRSGDQQAPEAEPSKEHKGLLKRCKRVLREQVEEVRLSRRLTESPSCLVLGDDELSPQLRRLLETTGQMVPESKPSLELNPDHPLVKRLEEESDQERFSDLVELLYGQAVLADGRELADPGSFVRRLNKVLLEAPSA